MPSGGLLSSGVGTAVDRHQFAGDLDQAAGQRLAVGGAAQVVGKRGQAFEPQRLPAQAASHRQRGQPDEGDHDDGAAADQGAAGAPAGEDVAVGDADGNRGRDRDLDPALAFDAPARRDNIGRSEVGRSKVGGVALVAIRPGPRQHAPALVAQRDHAVRAGMQVAELGADQILGEHRQDHAGEARLAETFGEAQHAHAAVIGGTPGEDRLQHGLVGRHFLVLQAGWQQPTGAQRRRGRRGLHLAVAADNIQRKQARIGAPALHQHRIEPCLLGCAVGIGAGGRGGGTAQAVIDPQQQIHATLPRQVGQVVGPQLRLLFGAIAVEFDCGEADQRDRRRHRERQHAHRARHAGPSATPADDQGAPNPAGHGTPTGDTIARGCGRIGSCRDIVTRTAGSREGPGGHITCWYATCWCLGASSAMRLRPGSRPHSGNRPAPPHWRSCWCRRQARASYSRGRARYRSANRRPRQTVSCAGCR